MNQYDEIVEQLAEIGEALMENKTTAGLGSLLLCGANIIKNQNEIIKTNKEVISYALSVIPERKSNNHHNPCYTISCLENLLDLHDRRNACLSIANPEIADNDPWRLALLEAISCVRLVHRELCQGSLEKEEVSS